MCGEICEEVSIQCHTTCFKCFAKYGMTFKDPEAFHDAYTKFSSEGHLDPKQEPHADATPDCMVGEVDHTSMPATAPVELLRIAAASTPKIYMYKVGLTCRDFSKALTLLLCTIEKDASDRDLSQFVSITAVPLSTLSLNGLMLFCSTHEISGYRQKGGSGSPHCSKRSF